MWERYCLRPVEDSTPTVLPVFLYGTAWKKDQTADLVYTAVSAGFRAIDTAAQPRHYQEHLVGDGIRKAIADGVVRREDLYVKPRLTAISRT
jgi:diketogulonate reductase-like aldo/keto reductase